MGFISGIKGLIGLGQSGEKVVGTGLELATMGARGIDALFHTEEEKAHEAIAAKKDWFAHCIEMSKIFNMGSAGAAKARRYLAKLITWFTLLLATYVIGIMSWGYLTADIVDGVAQTQRVDALVKGILSIVTVLYIGQAFAAVVATYFIYHGVRSAIAAKK